MSGTLRQTWTAVILLLALLSPLAPDFVRATKGGMCCRVRSGACQCPMTTGLGGSCVIKSSCGSEAPVTQSAPQLAWKGMLPRPGIVNVDLVPAGAAPEVAAVLAPQASPVPPDRPPRLVG
jgi:hypothetical protein